MKKIILDYIKFCEHDRFVLTKGEYILLVKIGDSHWQELDQFIPGGWMVEENHVAGVLGWSLLKKALIKEVDCGGNYGHHVYALNEDAITAMRLYEQEHGVKPADFNYDN